MTGLNLDVLLVICGILTDVSTVLSFSLTCSTLRPFAVERRLSMRPVTIDHAKSLRDLCNFILMDKKARGSHIHTIIIQEREPGSSLAISTGELVECMLAVLASATRIRTLSLHVPQHCQSGLLRHPRFLTAVSDITCLQELDTAGSMAVALKILGTTRSPLKTWRHRDIATHNEFQEPRSVVAPQLTSTLQEIELPYASFVTAFKASVALPAVGTATVTAVTELRQLKLDALLAVVPNLDGTLILRERTPIGRLPSDSDASLLALREENREAQKTHGWAALDRVATSPLVLFVLGLACPIRHLSLAAALKDYLDRPQDSAHTRVVLEEHAPAHLALADIKLPYGFALVRHWPEWLFPDAAAARLTHLALDAQYTNIPSDPQPREGDDPDALWDAELDTLLAGLRALHKLTHLRLVFRCDVVHERGPFSAAIYYGMRCFRFGRLLAALPGAVPSLTHIFIATAGRAAITTFGRAYDFGRRQRKETWDVSRAWRVRRPAAARVLVLGAPGGSVDGETPVHDVELEELTDEEREAGIDGEELRATEKTEVRCSFRSVKP